ncbi:MAG: hypothetical protein JW811_04750 [Clostridiales bacterium]|nr:hypothetical protein [Clostridiales bacterium]
MSRMDENAGLLPAFMEYRLLGARYGRLIDQFRTSRQVHAYLFAGPQGIGKKTFARYLASVLLCESETKPCGVCSQCRAIYAGKHSSVIEVSPADNKVIPIDRIRELVSLSSMHSLDDRERVIIIEPTESMMPQAQNCLLKSLEDPDTNVIYFILSHDTSSLLDTVVSRCFAFKLTSWPGELLSKHLRKKYPQNDVMRAVALSGGNVGEALAILNEQHDGAQETALFELLSVKSAKDAVRCSGMLKGMAGSAEQVLFRLERYLQQCMLVKSGLLPADIMEGTPWNKTLRGASIPDLADLTDQVFKTRQRKMSYVNWQSNIDQLTCRLLEAKSEWQKS